MKKRIALFVMFMFVLGCFTQAFAKENNSTKKELANSEVKVNKNTLTENSPLVKAIRSLDLAKVKQAVAKGANVNSRLNDENNFTPLHVLATIPQDAQKAEKAKQIADFLIAQGADVNARAKKGETPLHIALFKNNTEMSKFLVDKGADIHARTNSCKAPIHNVRSKEMLDFLNSKGAYKSSEDDCEGRTLLHYAAGRGDLEIVKSIVDTLFGKLEVDREDRVHMTPLCLAAANGEIEVVKFLVENKADVNNKYLPSLDCASRGGDKETVKFLISKGANVNASGKGGTPLCTAVRNDYIEIVKLLLDNGADVNMADVFGSIPLDIAKSEEVKALLLKHGAKSGDASYIEAQMEEAISNNDPKKMETALKDLDLTLPKHRRAAETSLYKAASYGQEEIVKILLNKGVNVNGRDFYSYSAPLHGAVSANNKKMVKFLISKGADVNQKNGSDQTPLDLVKSEEIKKILIKHGAKSGKDLK